jgi:hypothetical protein
MAQQSELMALGMPSALAGAVGSGPSTSITPAGSTQTGATALSSPVTVLATASAAGVRLPSATGAPVYAIFNNSGADQTLYPASGETINASTANTGFTITSAKSAICVPSGQKWIVNLSA